MILVVHPNQIHLNVPVYVDLMPAMNFLWVLLLLFTKPAPPPSLIAGMDMRPMPTEPASIETIAEWMRKKEWLDFLTNPNVSLHSKINLLERVSLDTQAPRLDKGGLMDKWNDDYDYDDIAKEIDSR